MIHIRPAAALVFGLLLTTTALSGCIDAIKGDEDTPPGDEKPPEDDSTGVPVAVDLTSDEAASAGYKEFHITTGEVKLHQKGAPDEEWHTVSMGPTNGTLIEDGKATTATVGDGKLPPGEYDRVQVAVTMVHLVAKEAEEHAHDGGGGGGHQHGVGKPLVGPAQGHDHGDGGHDHGDGDAMADDGGAHEGHEGHKSVELDLGSDIQLKLAEGSDGRVVLVMDPDGTDTSSDPVSIALGQVLILEGGEEVLSFDPNKGVPARAEDKPPVARITIFDGDGAQIYAADFVAGDDAFVNSVGSAYAPGDQFTFSGSDSEVQVGGTEIETFSWDFDDGTTQEGGTVTHAWEGGGAFEVTLTVIDSRGIRDTQTVRLIILPEEPIDTFTLFSFDGGQENWTGTAETRSPVDGSRSGDGTWTWSHVDSAKEGPGWGLTGDTPDPPGGGLVGGGASLNFAWLTSGPLDIPEGISVGYQFDVVGGGGNLAFEFSMDEGETWEAAQAIDPAAEWVTAFGNETFTDHMGHKGMLLRFAWASGGSDPGEGWTLDNVKIVGISYESLANGDLLREAGQGDGHDHAH